MKTYDAGAGTHGSRPFLKSVKDVIRRFFDRERELMSLRNAVGMMSEARRADAVEWHEMYDLNRELRADAMRFRWLTEDHTDAAVRERALSIAASIPTRTISGTRLDIDANMHG